MAAAPSKQRGQGDEYAQMESATRDFIRHKLLETYGASRRGSASDGCGWAIRGQTDGCAKNSRSNRPLGISVQPGLIDLVSLVGERVKQTEHAIDVLESDKLSSRKQQLAKFRWLQQFLP
jgi:hypothetical protein